QEGKMEERESRSEVSAEFSEVEHVAKSWMLDFVIGSLCHHFRHDKYKEFNQSLSVLEALIPGFGQFKSYQKKMINICFVLSRIVNGKKTSLQYEEDARITPLMSASHIWNVIEQEIEQKTLYEDIKRLLFVQSVAVCLQSGQHQKASWVLERLTETTEVPQNLRMKLSMIVNKKDAYHQFLLNFSFDVLLEKIKILLDSFQKDYLSDFLLKAASKVVEASKEKGVEEETSPEGNSFLCKTSNIGSRKVPENLFSSVGEITASETITRSLTSRSLSLVDSRARRASPTCSSLSRSSGRPSTRFKKGAASKRYNSGTRLSFDFTKRKTSELKKKRVKRHWTFEENQALKAGVRRYGEGNWAKILKHFEFNNRTGVMLKDRWRTMKKLYLVSENNSSED
uniref:Telomeric repeat-binding factor n=1 Tax=Lepisosteus oculatus TaxID=7918 RepID=W5M829_LEPOC